jgi:hypothetical protein
MTTADEVLAIAQAADHRMMLSALTVTPTEDGHHLVEVEWHDQEFRICTPQNVRPRCLIVETYTGIPVVVIRLRPCPCGSGVYINWEEGDRYCVICALDPDVP